MENRAGLSIAPCGDSDPLGPAADAQSASDSARSYDWVGLESMLMLSGLPVGVAAFVGRERERAKVADLLADARVVTLTGPGGCGKTRLAVEIVGDVASRFSDGARWVDLQGLSEPGLVAPAMAAAVDVHERPEEALIDTLAEHLRARHLLVVLDNCEHLVEACCGAGRRVVVGVSAAAPAGHQPRAAASSRVRRRSRSPGCRCPTPMLRPPARSRRRTQRGCSRCGPGRWPRTFGSVTTTLRRWPRSAGVWMGSRWRSSWRRRGCGCWRRARSRPGCRTGSGC